MGYEGEQFNIMVEYYEFVLTLFLFEIVETLVIFTLSFLMGFLIESVIVFIGIVCGRLIWDVKHLNNKLKCGIKSSIYVIIFSIIGSYFGFVSCFILGILFVILNRKR